MQRCIAQTEQERRRDRADRIDLINAELSQRLAAPQPRGAKCLRKASDTDAELAVRQTLGLIRNRHQIAVAFHGADEHLAERAPEVKPERSRWQVMFGE